MIQLLPHCVAELRASVGELKVKFTLHEVTRLLRSSYILFVK